MSAKQPRFFYGWWVVLAIMMIFFAMTANPFNIVLKQLMTEFDSGRGMVSLAPSMSTISGGIAGLFVGRLLINQRPKRFMLGGIILGGVSLLLISLTQELWQVYVLYFINGVAMAGAGALAMFTLLSKWFVKKFGTVSGIVMAGGALGSMITPLVGIIAENLGWRATYIFSGTILLVMCIPLILFVIKDSPDKIGLSPDGETVYNEPGKATIPSSAPVKQTANLSVYFKRPALWAMGLSFLFIAIGDSAVTAHQVSFITDMNIREAVAASALGFTLGISAISRMGSGWLADRISSRYVVIMFLIIEVGGMLLLMQASTISDIWLFVVVYGLGVGASTTLLPLVLKDIFGTAAFSMLFAVLDLFFRGGYTLGIPFAGFVFDATGSYRLVFTIIIVLYITAGTIMYFTFGASPKPFMKRLKTVKMN